jgi:[ribosomal protein S5]-alanine N-acetyltransferase
LIETDRLLLRPPTEADADMAGHLDQWRRFGIGKFVVERRDDGLVLGRVGIQLLDAETWEPAAGPGARPELGWTLRPEHWGNGYATEAARAVLDWFDGSRVISLIPPDNLRSQRVAGRLGAVPTESVTLSDSSEAVVWLHPQRSRPSASSSADRG